MAHFKCVACRLRLQVDRSSAEDTGDSCPVCDVPLEPVADLREVVGFRFFEPGAKPEESRDHRPLTRRLEELRSRRDAAELAKAEAERWLDERETLPGVETVALPLPGTEL